jgi:penicillin-binding protein 2
MFQRRLKILLILMVLIGALLILRAMQIQWIQRNYWRSEAADLMKRWEPVETTRGSILDRKGRVLAFDAPCIDACVDYRAIVEDPDEDWLRQIAQKRLVDELGDQYAQVRRSDKWPGMLDAEVAQAQNDLTAMWAELARVSGKSPDDLDDLRRSIVERVEMRRRYIWWRDYEHASKQSASGKSPRWYRDFLMDSGSDEDIDQFELDVAEQTEPHVILPAVDPVTQAILARQENRFFALSLRPSKHREYPYARSACHLMGMLRQVGPDQLGANDPFGDDELRRYWPNDSVGSGGIEGLCEKTLRGARGRVEKVAGSDETLASVDPIPGQDVRMTIDIDLQQDIEAAFVKRREFKDGTAPRYDQHGAAVVLDVATGAVLAMASNPGFDPNMLDTEYPMLSRDDLNLPLMNRATQMALEPGSTVKTIVGCGSITHGFMTPTSTIECTGYLVLRGVKYHVGRCWVAGLYEAGKIPSPMHHPVPVPHPTGFLTISDGLERSCNVVFETIADMMGMRELSFWFNQFGLGRPTGIGIEESPGMIPDPVDASIHSPLRMWTWFAGIGQGRVHATPLQMAQVAATIARDGIWMRPRLVADEDMGPATTRPFDPGPEVVDLHLDPQAVAAVREGMRRVVNSDAGTGTGILPQNQNPQESDDPLDGIEIAGKTGSAQTQLMTIPFRDANGNIVKVDGRIERVPVELGTPGTEGWYQGTGAAKHMDHAWFIGYAPASHPQVAFCVMVEYGEAGGPIAGAIAHDVLEACVRRGYLSASR